MFLAGNTLLAATTFIIGATTDINPDLAKSIYEVTIGIYDRADEGARIKVMSATAQPSLAINHTKKNYPSKTLARKGKEAFGNSLVKVLGLALRANRERVVSGQIDTPRFIRELRNHVGQDAVTVIIIGSPIWRGDLEFSFIDASQTDKDRRFRRPTHGSVSVDKLLSHFSMEGIPDMPNCRVIWFDPTGDVESSDDAYKAEVANFWNCMLNEVSIPMAPVQSNAITVVDMAFKKDFEFLSLDFNASEQGARMVTLEELRTHQILSNPAEAFTHLWVADLSPSQSSVREAMARRLSDARGVKGQYHGLYVFESGNGTLYGENSDVLELAAAFRQVNPNGGADYLGSFCATLKKVRDELRLRRARNCSISILSDVAPKVDSSLPESDQYLAILQEILGDGHSVTFVKTNRMLDVSGFIPREIKIKITEL